MARTGVRVRRSSRDYPGWVCVRLSRLTTYARAGGSGAAARTAPPGRPATPRTRRSRCGCGRSTSRWPAPTRRPASSGGAPSERRLRAPRRSAPASAAYRSYRSAIRASVCHRSSRGSSGDLRQQRVDPEPLGDARSRPTRRRRRHGRSTAPSPRCRAGRSRTSRRVADSASPAGTPGARSARRAARPARSRSVPTNSASSCGSSRSDARAQPGDLAGHVDRRAAVGDQPAHRPVEQPPRLQVDRGLRRRSAPCCRAPRPPPTASRQAVDVAHHDVRPDHVGRRTRRSPPSRGRRTTCRPG